MPSEPIINLIATNVINTLKTISTINGYHVTLSDVEQELPEGNSPRHLKAVVTRGVPSERDDAPLNYIAWDYPFTVVTLFAAAEEGSPELTLRQAHEWIHSDIYKAMRQDETRGGYAIDTTVTSDPDGELLNTTVTVWYRHRQDNPTSQT